MTLSSRNSPVSSTVVSKETEFFRFVVSLFGRDERGGESLIAREGYYFKLLLLFKFFLCRCILFYFLLLLAFILSWIFSWAVVSVSSLYSGISFSSVEPPFWFRGHHAFSAAASPRGRELSKHCAAVLGALLTRVCLVTSECASKPFSSALPPAFLRTCSKNSALFLGHWPCFQSHMWDSAHLPTPPLSMTEWHTWLL